VLQRDVRIFLSHFQDGLTPQAGAFQHIRLVDAEQLFAAAACQFKRGAGDPFDFKDAVALRVVGFRTVCAFPAPVVAEIHAAGQFADKHNVDALGGDRRMQRAGAGQGRMQDSRTQVGIQAQLAAQTQKRAFRSLVARQRVPLRTANGAQQDRVASAAGHDGGGRQGLARRVDRDASGQQLFELEFVAIFCRDGFKDKAGAVGDFRTDTITRDDGDAITSHSDAPYFLRVAM